MIEAYAGQLHSADDLIPPLSNTGSCPSSETRFPVSLLKSYAHRSCGLQMTRTVRGNGKDRQHGAANASMENYLTRKLDS